jgi:hypothetical protein
MVRLGIATLGVGLFSLACATPTLHYPAKGATPPPLYELWQEPRNLPKRDLFYGVGGREHVPNPRAHYQFKSADTTGASRGYKVRDDAGTTWDIKLGEEVQPEIVVSRLLWAIGFHQPPVYYMPPGWTISGAPGWIEGADGPQNGARFRPHLPNHETIGAEWSWYDNPFVGTRPFKGLVLANLIFANWDYKADNNRIYRVKPPIGEASRIFVVQDLGASLGMQTPHLIHKLRLRSLRGSKNRIEDFERTGFIRSVHGDRVEFDYQDRLDPGLFENISPADVRWVCNLFSRLSDRQWNDAFRAAGYQQELRERYIKKIKEKVAQGAAL